MSWHKLVIKDALWQLFGRIISALFGFMITKIIASYLWPLRYGDYGTIFRFFARWTALVDFGIYVLALKQLWALKEKTDQKPDLDQHSPLAQTYGKFVGTRVILIGIIYSLAIAIAYLIPAYTSNPFIIRGLPLAMCYSASNMYAGIQQLPLQLFRKMKRLTRSLIIARISQLAVLLPVVYLFFANVDFQQSSETDVVLIVAFCLVIFSVVVSSIGQNVEMHLRTKDLLPLKIRFDFSFIKKLLSSNRRFGFSYFFSSFHTLLVLMFLGWFFPTSEGYKYAGVWALSLSLIEILLIIPSSLGNSLLHKITSASAILKKQALGNLMAMIVTIGVWIAMNFWLFADSIILIVSKSSFLGSWASPEVRGSNQILPFLGIVLLLSFIKQVYNYTFVALEQQNRLFAINAIGVAIGAGIGLWLVPQYGLLGGVITQLLIEILFTWGAIVVAARHHLTPRWPRKRLSLTLVLLGVVAWVSYLLLQRLCSEACISIYENTWLFLAVAGGLNILWLALLFSSMKKRARGLTPAES